MERTNHRNAHAVYQQYNNRILDEVAPFIAVPCNSKTFFFYKVSLLIIDFALKRVFGFF